MKNISKVFCIIFILLSTTVYSNSVIIVDASNKTVLQLKDSKVNVEVNDQVAVVTTTQTFYNQLGISVSGKFAFPLYEDATATSLRWELNGVWKSASFSPTEQDTTLPGGNGGSVDPDLTNYLGATPLYFDFKDSIPAGASITFELTYVQLLDYAYNIVSLDYPNDYHLIQTTALDTLSFDVNIYSDRSIVGIDLISHNANSISFTGNNASANYFSTNNEADKDYSLQYKLDSTELGLFGFSTYLTDSMNVCDDFGNGFFAFIVEPDPRDSIVIQKVFTLIIDRSGSMDGDKIQQAKDAASYIVNNLNFGDKFNIIDFATSVTSLFTDHVDVNLANQTTAINYINSITATSSTNISGAFDVAIPQFSNSDPDVSNIIIFMTDGQPSAGITSTDGILTHVSSLITTNGVDGLSINSFGIGYDVNTSLLAQLAADNNGISQFFSSGDLLQTITDFYVSIQNPVLINTTMSVDPSITYETYPNPLPNLYKGHQLVVVGRYATPGDVTVSFSGTNNGNAITYQYTFNLTDSLIEKNLFLTKIWAIEKINNLMTQYYILDPNSTEAIDLKGVIVNLSLCYGVISPFTSFTSNNNGGSVSVEDIGGNIPFTKLSNFPNPFRESTTILFEVTGNIHEIVPCIIMDVNGNVVQVLQVLVNGAGKYQIIWDGKDSKGLSLNAGVYPFYFKLGDSTMKGVMEKY